MSAKKRLRIPFRDDPARGIAFIFFLVGEVGLIPAFLGLVLLLVFFVSAVASLNLLAMAGFGLLLAYAFAGFLLHLDYIRRMLGKRRPGMWVGTLIFNLLPAGLSVLAVAKEPSAFGAVASLWFVGLSMLALAGMRLEKRADNLSQWEQRHDEAIARLALVDSELLRRRERGARALADFDRRLGSVSLDFGGADEVVRVEEEAHAYAA